MILRPKSLQTTARRHRPAVPSTILRVVQALTPRSATVTLTLCGTLVLTSGACITSLRSTDGGRRESRRQCLAAARDAGWRVVDIGQAQFKGAARYEVSLVVEKDSVPQQTLTCAYDLRTAVSDLRTGS